MLSGLLTAYTQQKQMVINSQPESYLLRLAPFRAFTGLPSLLGGSLSSLSVGEHRNEGRNVDGPQRLSDPAHHAMALQDVGQSAFPPDARMVPEVGEELPPHGFRQWRRCGGVDEDSHAC